MRIAIVSDEQFDNTEIVLKWVRHCLKQYNITQKEISKWLLPKTFKIDWGGAYDIYTEFSQIINNSDMIIVFWDEYNKDTGNKVYLTYMRNITCSICLYNRPNYIEECEKNMGWQ